MAHAGGRPLKYKTVDEIIPLIDKFFLETPEDEWTITGLALALDTDRMTVCEYGDRDEFSSTIKRAKLKIVNGYEKDLKKHGRVGTIFALKNFDWKDKQEIEQKVDMYEHKTDRASKLAKTISGITPARAETSNTGSKQE